MSSMAMPPPAPMQPPQNNPAATSNFVQQGSQMQQEGQSQDPSQVGPQQLSEKVKMLEQTLGDVAGMAEVVDKKLLVHVMKMAEIGKALKQDIDEMIKAKPDGSQQVQQGPPSPTDAAQGT